MEETTKNTLEQEPKDCDIASKPASSPIPAGYSILSYPKCDTKTGDWYWYDPSIAGDE